MTLLPSFRWPLFLLICVGLCFATACAPPQLSEVQARVFGPSCASFGACHDASNPSGGMSLVEGETFAAIVDVEAQEAGWLRVSPGNPEESLLYVLLTEGVGDTSKMPPSFSLQDEDKELVRAWIAAGAVND